MKTNNATDDLNQMILQLKNQQEAEWIDLKDKFHDLKENLKPLNIIKDTLEEINSGIDIKSNLLQSIFSIAAGYLSKRILVGTTHNKVTKFFGSIFQLVVTNFISRKTAAHSKD
ncbi:hypothetical protein [Flavobacterium hydatis]|jgi:hypothetical protein|uniref:Uncharacterized protein n=1 Tax=Flavobacterium hydatis TaxID=991 RepID=A0A085ZUU6_FLAHY|nr:hypothetical protein [Flavobacterium hydatis]KFF08210.1 hypothetical protein IW20_23890 [Flavobacterium hydatis]OXA85692.1 hypothetical protein B0A62_24395 [Flavobacterium hydatis]